MSADHAVRDEDVVQLLRQCHSDLPLDQMWTWNSDTVLAAVSRVELVTPALATYVVSRGYPQHLLTRSDIPLESIDAVWALLMIDLPDLRGITVRWFTTMGMLLRSPWRDRAPRFFAASFASVRAGGVLGQLPAGRELEGRAAALYLITDRSEPLHIRAELLRELEWEQPNAPLTSLVLPDEVLRAAYRCDPFIDRERAEALLTHASVLADSAWCTELIALASNYVVADLPVRALKLLPTPRNAEVATALLHTHVFPNSAALRGFASHLWLAPTLLRPLVTRADVLRCVAVVREVEVREGLLRILATVG